MSTLAVNRYFISADIEGISGVSADSFSYYGGRHYEQGRRYMVQNINSVIEGILEADPTADIVVRDAHHTAQNIDLGALHHRASLVQGWGKSMSFLEGIDTSFKSIFLVGYHAGAQNSDAVLSHTFSLSFARILLNGLEVNETALAALEAETVNVPIVFLSGDDQACLEATQQISGLETVAVKKSLARDSVCSLGLHQAGELLKNGAARAVKNTGSRFLLKAPYVMEIELLNTAYLPSLYVHMKNVLQYEKQMKFDDSRKTISFQGANASEVLRAMCLIFYLSVGVASIQKNQ